MRGQHHGTARMGILRATCAQNSSSHKLLAGIRCHSTSQIRNTCQFMLEPTERFQGESCTYKLGILTANNKLLAYHSFAKNYKPSRLHAPPFAKIQKRGRHCDQQRNLPKTKCTCSIWVTTLNFTSCKFHIIKIYCTHMCMRRLYTCSFIFERL